MKKAKNKNGKVFLVGAGPGDPGLLTLKGAQYIAQADVILYDRLVNPAILELNMDGQHIYVGKEYRRGMSVALREQKAINNKLTQLAKQGKQVVRLKGGDPFVFGRGGEEISHLKKQKIAYEVIPGISAGFAVPAYAGIPVTDRRHASTVTFVTAHEDLSKKEEQVRWDSLARHKGTLIFFMGVANLKNVVSRLKTHGKAKTTLVSVIERGTLPGQRVIQGSLGNIVSKVQKAKLTSPALTVVGAVNRLRKDLGWFEKKPLHGKTVMITRARTQASQLRKCLEVYGARVLEFPAIEIKAPKSWAPLDNALKRVQDFDWIVFTSVNAVESVFGRLDKLKKDARSLKGVRVAAIGEATKEALKAMGIRADLTPKAFTSKALVQKLKEKKCIQGQRYLLPRTDIAPEYLNTALKRLGAAEVKQVVAYRTAPAKKEMSKLKKWVSEEPIDYVLFSSSSTVDYFFRSLDPKLKKSLKAKLVSIGPITSQTLRGLGYKPFREAKEHTIPGLVQTLLK